MDKLLTQLIGKLQKAYGERLVSVVLYGSAAAGDHHADFSDINVLCILSEISPRELAAGEGIFRWWREQGSPSPLLLTENEVAHLHGLLRYRVPRYPAPAPPAARQGHHHHPGH